MSSSNRFLMLALVGFLPLAPLPLSAQAPADDASDAPQAPQTAPAVNEAGTRIAVGLGLGVGSLGVGGTLSLGLGTSAGDFVLRTSGSEEWSLFGPTESVGDVALLYGRTSRGEAGWVRLAAGPALVEVVEVGEATNCNFFFCDYERVRTNTIGLAAQADAVWALASWFGLGVNVFGNVNSRLSFAGAGVTVSLGALR